MYKVFEVNDCFEDYAMSYRLIGANDIDDLIEHFPEISKEAYWGKKKMKNIIKEKEWRIKEMEHLFTDNPYHSLDCWGYME